MILRSAENLMALALYKEENVLPFHKRQREFNFLGQTLRIHQDWGKLGVAAVVWDSVCFRSW